MPSERLTSLDQFRGYTVVGMLLVNFLPNLSFIPPVLRHHNTYCSYADTIMPQFLFAAGCALRWVYLRELAVGGVAAARWRTVRRCWSLALLSIVLYTLGDYPLYQPSGWSKLWTAVSPDPLGWLGGMAKRTWFQTLLHIAVTTVWVIPVLHREAWWRGLFAALSVALHVGLSWWFNFAWCNTDPVAIDGGPLGFLTWSVPMLAGTIVIDAIRSDRVAGQLRAISAWGLTLMLVGYLISCGTRWYDIPKDSPLAGQKVIATDPVVPTAERWRTVAERGWQLAEPPLVRPSSGRPFEWNYWMMSQRAGTPAYLIFSAGLSCVVFVLFWLICDGAKLQLPLFRSFGKNALAAYVIHGFLGDALQAWLLKPSALELPLWGDFRPWIRVGTTIEPQAWWFWSVFVIYFAINYAAVWYMDRRKWIWRV
jgi:hypothetical protein